MRVASKTKTYTAIEVKHNAEFYLKLGKFLDEEDYSIDQKRFKLYPNIFS